MIKRVLNKVLREFRVWKMHRANGKPGTLMLSWKIDYLTNVLPREEWRTMFSKWIYRNITNNSGDSGRLSALILNVKQIIGDGVIGDFAELGVYKGNTSAVLMHYAKQAGRELFLFDTFEGFDDADRIGVDADQGQQFTETSIDDVRMFVGGGYTYRGASQSQSRQSVVKSCGLLSASMQTYIYRLKRDLNSFGRICPREV